MSESIESINYAEIGARIRAMREHVGLTQEQLAEACGLSASFIGHIERGSRKLSVESLYKLASVLNISADHLLFGCRAQETSCPPEIEALLRGAGEDRQRQFWRTVRALAAHLDEL